MMGRSLAPLWLMLALAACSAAAEPKAFPYFEKDGGRVRDMAQVLSPETEQRLTAQLDAAEARYGPQLAVVTVSSLHDYPIEDFSLFYARAWGLGDRKRNDGLLLLVAPNERKVRIEVGKGVEGTFTDVYCKEVLDHVLLPRFKKGDLEGGISAGVNELVVHMQEHPTLPANDNTAHPPAAKAA
jgi:uncharacterized protein